MGTGGEHRGCAGWVRAWSCPAGHRRCGGSALVMCDSGGVRVLEAKPPCSPGSAVVDLGVGSHVLSHGRVGAAPTGCAWEGLGRGSWHRCPESTHPRPGVSPNAGTGVAAEGGSPRGRPACLQDKPPGRHRPPWSWATLGAGGWQSLAVGLGMVHAAGEPWGCGPWHGGEGVQASGTRDPGVPLAPCSQPCPGMPGYRGAGDWNWLLQLKWRHRWRPAHSAAWRNAWRS